MVLRGETAVAVRAPVELTVLRAPAVVARGLTVLAEAERTLGVAEAVAVRLEAALGVTMAEAPRVAGKSLLTAELMGRPPPPPPASAG